MSMLAKIFSVFALTFASASTQAAPWSTEKIFVFENMIFDFNRHLSSADRLGDGTSDSLEDCSTTELYCLKTAFSSIALPRTCATALKTGDGWSVGDIQTVVVGEVTYPPGHHAVPDGPLYILQSKRNSNFAILYKRSSGPIGIFYSANKELDLARVRGKQPVSFDALMALLGDAYKRPITYENFAPCTFAEPK